MLPELSKWLFLHGRRRRATGGSEPILFDYWPRQTDRRRVMAAVLIAFACASCGHPASLNECEQIVERVTVLQVRQEQLITDKESLAREAEHQKKVQHEAMMHKCVGKRITDSIMRCVRSAKTADEIVNRCFE